MSFRIIIFTFLCLGIIEKGYAQTKYSIDVKSKKERRVPVSYKIGESKKEYEAAREWRKNNRIEKRLSKQTKQRIYKVQTQEVKKRMKRSEKKAKNNNRGKVPLRVKLKRLMSNG